MTKYGRPASVAPASKTRAMLTWSIIASAWRSASKRAMTWRLSMPGLMTLSATLRWTGSRLLGHEDGAHAAFADLLQQLVRADNRAGRFGGHGRIESRCWFKQRLIQKTARCIVRLEQALDLSPQAGIALASTIQKRGAFGRGFLFDGCQEDFIGLHCVDSGCGTYLSTIQCDAISRRARPRAENLSPSDYASSASVIC